MVPVGRSLDTGHRSTHTLSMESGRLTKNAEADRCISTNGKPHKKMKVGENGCQWEAINDKTRNS